MFIILYYIIGRIIHRSTYLLMDFSKIGNNTPIGPR